MATAKAKETGELRLMNMFLGAASERLPRVRLFRRAVLNLELSPGIRVRSGIPGQADLYGVVRGGRLIELELKAATGRLSEAQERWRDWCHAWGVTWLELKAQRGESAEGTVSRWVAELEAVL